jgi:hypothetical protein
MNQQPSVYGIGQQMFETIRTETSLILQQSIPFRSWKVGLQPKHPMNALRVQTAKTCNISGSRHQVHSRVSHLKPLGLKRPTMNVCVDTKLKLYCFKCQIKNMSD